jgi:hypothetical protein
LIFLKMAPGSPGTGLQPGPAATDHKNLDDAEIVADCIHTACKPRRCRASAMIDDMADFAKAALVH